MRRITAIISFLFLAFSCLAETITGKVVSVYDGDTVTILDGTSQVKVRLAAEEVSWESDPVE